LAISALRISIRWAFSIESATSETAFGALAAEWCAAFHAAECFESYDGDGDEADSSFEAVVPCAAFQAAECFEASLVALLCLAFHSAECFESYAGASWATGSGEGDGTTSAGAPSADAPVFKASFWAFIFKRSSSCCFFIRSRSSRRCACIFCCSALRISMRLAASVASAAQSSVDEAECDATSDSLDGASDLCTVARVESVAPLACASSACASSISEVDTLAAAFASFIAWFCAFCLSFSVWRCASILSCSAFRAAMRESEGEASSEESPPSAVCRSEVPSSPSVSVAFWAAACSLSSAFFATSVSCASFFCARRCMFCFFVWSLSALCCATILSCSALRASCRSLTSSGILGSASVSGS